MDDLQIRYEAKFKEITGLYEDKIKLLQDEITILKRSIKQLKEEKYTASAKAQRKLLRVKSFGGWIRIKNVLRFKIVSHANFKKQTRKPYGGQNVFCGFSGLFIISVRIAKIKIIIKS